MTPQTEGMTSDNDPSQGVRDVVSDRCKKCGRKGRDMRCGVCDVCAFPGRDIMTHGSGK